MCIRQKSVRSLNLSFSSLSLFLFTQRAPLCRQQKIKFMTLTADGDVAAVVASMSRSSWLPLPPLSLLPQMSAPATTLAASIIVDFALLLVLEAGHTGTNHTKMILTSAISLKQCASKSIPGLKNLFTGSL